MIAGLPTTCNKSLNLGGAPRLIAKLDSSPSRHSGGAVFRKFVMPAGIMSKGRLSGTSQADWFLRTASQPTYVLCLYGVASRPTSGSKLDEVERI